MACEVNEFDQSIRHLFKAEKDVFWVNPSIAIISFTSEKLEVTLKNEESNLEENESSNLLKLLLITEELTLWLEERKSTKGLKNEFVSKFVKSEIDSKEIWEWSMAWKLEFNWSYIVSQND
jgi:hypothetical protein